MIVKILGNKGGGSAGAAIDYMLGKERDRDGAILLSGDPDLTARLADNLDFQNRYTVGVLSFEEANLEEQQKQEIMQSFEETLLAGLDKEQYNITWIEHVDKGRLELNFIIPKIDLNSGKAMNPYFDKVDRDLVNTWKNVTNYKYGLTNPDDPEKKQSHIIAKDLPRDKKKLSESIGNSLLISITEGKIQTRQDVIKHIESLGLEVARVTPTAISIKDPDGKRNIRLKGEMYEENFRYSERYTEQKRAESSQFRRNFAESSESERNKLSELVGKKRSFNENRFKRKEQPIADRDNKYLRSDPIKPREVDSIKSESRQSQDVHFDSRNDINNNPDYFDRRELVAQQVRSEPLRREDGITAENRENVHRAQNIGENRLSGGQGDDLHQNQEENGSKQGLRGLDHIENEKVIKQWTKDELLERNLTEKQADYCLKEQRKAFNPMWTEDAQLRQLERIQEKLNAQIENGTVGKDQDRGR